ncbi:DUF2972 domain-containing protein [Campylobacter armoricus]|uniref:DUF2972 domain-containing protein n=1 Tax=Campylobacter armoricus TaxID=2505970 RepID=UPI001375AC90|nr:DUF2972 domain-containing protein [Campylobacter armoricus]
MKLSTYINANINPNHAKKLLHALKCSTNEEFHKLILNNISSVIEWFNSDDFKPYQNHLYPPLFNPKTLELDNSQYCANLAWDCNIPLNNSNVKFIYISPHGVGAAAFLTLLNQTCNVFCPASWMLQEDAKYRYMVNFMNFMDKNIAINISEINIINIEKYLCLLDPKIPILYQVRDPISLLKHSYGRDWSKVQRTYDKNFDLNYDYTLYIKYLTPNKTHMKDDFETLLHDTFFNHYLLQKINTNNIQYIDMNELSNKKSFNTLTKLANNFNFTPPHTTTKELFNRKEFRGYIRYLLPLVFHVNQNIKLTIDRYYINTEQYNIMDKFCNNNLKYDIGIYIDKNNLNIFLNHKNYNQIVNYLSSFLNDIKQIIDLTEDTMMKEDEVLYYLKHNINARLKLKNILDIELSHIKKHRPDIVSSWAYYQNFKSMCN